MRHRHTRVLAAVRQRLIVSCQAEDDDPFNAPDLVARFALAAAMGGAAAIRACGPESVRAIRAAVPLPIIGLTKGAHADGTVLITPTLDDIGALITAGADLVAVDGTGRTRPCGLTGDRFIAAAGARWPVPVIADVSTPREGIAAFRAGAAAVATTLAGYTARSTDAHVTKPDWKLLRALVQCGMGPVIFEGRIWTPAQAARGLQLGAYAVVVGTAISRPRVITRHFVEALDAVRAPRRNRADAGRDVRSRRASRAPHS